MGSSRLRGKTMADIGGVPALRRILDRLGRVAELDGVAVATTVAEEDEPIRACARGAGVPVHSGDPVDVLGRMRDAAAKVGARTVVRVTGDCPLVDPVVVSRALAAFARDAPDHLSNVLSDRPHPHGLDVEVVSFAALDAAAREATEPADREHVTRFLYTHPERFALRRLDASPALARPDLRLTVDTAEDLDLVRRVYAALEPSDPGFTAEDVVAWLDAHPEVRALNAHLVAP